ncbi:MAG: MBL fold metallo-hydrolase [Candidatus Methanosuratus sp.]|nr:MBL fold metallo-hydrolase [Candidatus Methanosuratincola sp.]
MTSPSPLVSRVGRFLVLHEESFVGVSISSNVYVLGDEGSYYLFDASGHPDLLSYLESAGIHGSLIAGAFLTHGHYDHVRGLESLRDYSVPVYLSNRDRRLMEETIRGYPSCTDLSDASGVLSRLGLVSILTPGHTPGSACFYSPGEALLISGDTVFSDGYFGRTDLPGGSDSDMLESLECLSRMKVEVLLAGHGPVVHEQGSRHISKALSCARGMLRR